MEQDNLFKKTEYALYNYKDLDIKIKSIEIDIEMLQNDITLKAINYDEKSGATNAFSISVENEVIRRDEVVKEQIQKLQRDKLLYVSRKNKIEMLIGRLVLNLLGGVIGCCLVLGFFWCLGVAINFMETHVWAFVTMIIVDIICIFKMINE